MKNNTKTKMLTIGIIALMILCSASILIDNKNETDATNIDQFERLYAGSWTWDTTTGIGPFNSFYAAFDITNGNRFVSVLNPYDLSKKIDGSTLPSGNYNIMWVVPTIYWYTDNTGNLVLTNDSSSGDAYAHTIDGHVYKYIAYGVYEGAYELYNNQYILVSKTGVSPTNSIKLTNLRIASHNYTMDSSLSIDSTYPAHSMVWNYYQFNLYRYFCFATTGSFNVQDTVGNGPVIYSSSMSPITTGATDTLGPYVGNNGILSDNSLTAGSYSVKLFIENAWGGYSEFVDGVASSNGSIYIDSSSNPSGATTGTFVESISYSFQNQYGSNIVQNAKTWGLSANQTGSYSTGLADRSWGGNGNCLNTGGAQYADHINAYSCGISRMSPSDSSYALTDSTSRLQFVFDADVTPITPSSYTYTLEYDPTVMSTGSNAIDVANKNPISHDAPTYTVSFVSDNSSNGTVNVPTISNVPAGAVATVSSNTITINGTTVTASKTTPDTAQYTYGFDGWYVGNSKITTSYIISDNVTITAKFTATVNNYTVSIQSNNLDYGTIDVGTIPNTPYASEIHINNNVMTINNTVVTATASDPNAYYTYGFDGYTTDGQPVHDGDTITGNRTIIANFSRTNIWTVIITPSNLDYGSVSVDQILGIPNGNLITVNGDELTVNGITSVATPNTSNAEYTYAFAGWSVANNTAVTQDMTVTANFTRTLNNYDVTISPNIQGYGTVSASSLNDVGYGTPITVSNNTITVGTGQNLTTITATPTPSQSTDHYTYSFLSWSGVTPTVTGDMNIVANFARYENAYNISTSVNNSDYGSIVDNGSLSNIPWGTTISISGNTVTIGTTTLTAIPADRTDEFTFAFASWSGITDNMTLTCDLTILATFTATVNEYTISFASNNLSYGSVDESSITADYGTPITVSENTITIDGTTVTATALEGYEFSGWDPIPGSTVTGTATYTAQFIDPNAGITVTFNGNGGIVIGSATKIVTTGEAIGDLPTASKTNNNFLGWFTAAEGGTQVTSETIVTEDADFTLYAQYELSGVAKSYKTLVYIVPTMLFILVMVGLVQYFNRGRY